MTDLIHPESANTRLRWLVLVILLWFATALLSPLMAQMVPTAGEQPAEVMELPENLTPLQVRELVARLSDAEVRNLIIVQLDKQAVAPDEQADADVYIGQLRGGIEVAKGALERVFASSDQVSSYGTPLPFPVIDYFKYFNRLD